MASGNLTSAKQGRIAMLKSILLTTAAVLSMAGAALAGEKSATPDDDVLTLAIRAVPDQEAWMAAAKPFNALLLSETGTIAVAEFKSIMGFAPVDANGQPVKNVFIGMIQVDNEETHAKLVSKLFGPDKPQEVTNYLKTIQNTGEAGKLRPYRDTPALDVAGMVKPGQVLEIAVRDVSGWDFADFDAKRKAFVEVLKAQKGMVAEYEYRSIDGKYYVGMTLYENPESLQAIASNPAVVQGPEMGALMAKYPPMVAQYLVRIE
jgi:hypothetical protein